jgi:hypothetical protein
MRRGKAPPPARPVQCNGETEKMVRKHEVTNLRMRMYAKPLIKLLLLTALVLRMHQLAIAGSDIRTERVQFKSGASSAVVEGSITGYETVDYVLRASKGQYMNVSMATDNTGNYFNILAPGEDEIAMFNGSISDNQYEGVSPGSGDYKIRVYQMRSAARRNEVANYRLEMIVTGGTAPSDKSPQDTASSETATRAGKGD